MKTLIIASLGFTLILPVTVAGKDKKKKKKKENPWAVSETIGQSSFFDLRMGDGRNAEPFLIPEKWKFVGVTTESAQRSRAPPGSFSGCG